MLQQASRRLATQKSDAHLYFCVHASHIHVDIQNESDIVKNAQPRLSICCDVVRSFKYIIRKPLQGNVQATEQCVLLMAATLFTHAHIQA